MSDDYEFEDDDAPVSKPKTTGPDFDPFADEAVDVAPKAAPPAAPAKTKSQAPAPAAAKKDDGFDPFADGDLGNGDGDGDGNDQDIVPGQGRDLWACPHCGAKNKPNKDVCRSCNKHKDDEVIIPLLSQTPVKLGLIAGAVVIILILFMVMTAKDLSLHSAGPDHVGSEFIHDGSTRLAGAGRILRVSGTGDNRDIVIVFGYEVTGKEFNELKGPNKNHEVTRGSYAVQPHVRLNVSGAASLADMKRGDYISFTGSWNGDGDSFAERVLTREFSVAASDMQFNLSSEE